MKSNFTFYLKKNNIFEQSYKYILEKNQGSNNPYHNNTHLIDVFVSTQKIAQSIDSLTENDIIELGVAALFHDMNHSGGILKNDEDNINLALFELDKFYKSHKDLFENINIDNIKDLIKCTKYPYDNEPKNIKEMIMRDADTIQCYDKNWFNNIILGYLVNELGLSIQKSIENQINYIKKVKYNTDFAKYIHEKERDGMLNNLYYLNDLYK